MAPSKKASTTSWNHASLNHSTHFETGSQAWRYSFGFGNNYVVNVASIIEHLLPQLPQLSDEFAFEVVPDSELPEAYAETTFNPPRIAARSSIYHGLIRDDPHARFTLAHELGHLLLHQNDNALRRSSSAGTLKTDKRFSAEWQADKFASSFLAPDYIARLFTDPTELSQNCLVSLRAAQVRLTELGIYPPKKPLPRFDFTRK